MGKYMEPGSIVSCVLVGVFTIIVSIEIYDSFYKPQYYEYEEKN
jgi:hypothetical protein